MLTLGIILAIGTFISGCLGLAGVYRNMGMDSGTEEGLAFINLIVWVLAVCLMFLSNRC